MTAKTAAICWTAVWLALLPCFDLNTSDVLFILNVACDSNIDQEGRIFKFLFAKFSSFLLEVALALYNYWEFGGARSLYIIISISY